VHHVDHARKRTPSSQTISTIGCLFRLRLRARPPLLPSIEDKVDRFSIVTATRFRRTRRTRGRYRLSNGISTVAARDGQDSRSSGRSRASKMSPFASTPTHLKYDYVRSAAADAGRTGGPGPLRALPAGQHQWARPDMKKPRARGTWPE